ncbi:hypothetical protein AX774_g1611 [Zancudomyces culisetae]|uniref:Uncharacterized protein n=1 Tax=Zancudomyces culisetae TaxID=1213189 RepID=A0A1R1PV58_ZANCU|nr:hypothetical protein AX774_g1611 [Zancudomyces culisetae]|eukprot:OMH84855.1 hypothetical protein AX774_g1611 [Zancudomyces culisetae]
MSGHMQQLRAAIIQQFKDEGRYSPDSDCSGATSMELDRTESHDPFAFVQEHVQQQFPSMKSLSKERDKPGLVRHCNRIKVNTLLLN